MPPAAILYRITVFDLPRLDSPMEATLRASPDARRNCPRCHALVDWRTCDPARSGTTEYRVCPECDQLVFVAWLKAEGSSLPGVRAPEAR